MKKTHKTKLIYLLAMPVILLVSSFASPVVDEGIISKSNFNNFEYKKVEENKTTVPAEDGEHTIYWAQGVEAPIVTYDKNLLGQKGYFNYEELNGYGTYQSEFEPNKGYFDYNKNLVKRGAEEHLCYLGAAANLISWWLEQNEVYVNEYIRRLKDTDIYEQVPGLYDVTKFDQSKWDMILGDPVLEQNGNYKSQQLGLSPLSKDILNPYYTKTDSGFFSDYVFDFFFNGYDPLPTFRNYLPNTEDQFYKSRIGGYFHPIFGKERLSQRLTGPEHNSHEYFEKNLRKLFSEGYGVSIGYVVNAKINHAITIWGAEYDSNGNLVKIYITDSDDSQASKESDEYWRGLVAFDANEDSNGRMRITSNANVTNEKELGNFIQDVILLDLAQDKFVDALNDTKGPNDAIITSSPSDRVLARNADVEVDVNATLMDRGYLDYQWFESKDNKSEGIPVPKGNSRTLKIDTTSIGKKYYYCEVRTIKNGKMSKVYTKPFCADIQDIAIKNAEIPQIRFSTSNVSVNQYTKSTPFYVNASVKDGGTLTYQWYVSTVSANNIEEDKWKILEGETSPYFYPSTLNEGTNFYFCVVTNTNNSSDITGNSITEARTQFSKRITVKKAEHINVETPIIIDQSNNYNKVSLNQPLQLKVRAKTIDGSMLSYQWFQINSDYSESLIEGQDKPILNVSTKVPGVKKYKCIVTATNDMASNNKSNTTSSNNFEVVVGNYNPSSDANLVSLTVSNATITPKFDPMVKEYTANAHINVEQLKIDAKANEGASVEITNPLLVPGKEQVVEIKVIAQDGTTNIYKIKVTRGEHHDYGPWVVIKEATCTSTGIERRYCNSCDHYEERIIAQKEHTYKDVVTKPTCEEQGYTTHTCTECGHSYVDNYVDALGHKYGDVIYSWNENHTSLTATHVCNECHHRESETVNATYEEISKPTCGNMGLGRFTSESFANPAFGVQTYDIDIPKLEHTYKDVVTKPTCEEQGYTTHTCTECGHSYVDHYVDALGHKYGDVIYSWNEDYTSLTATHVCNECHHRESETVSVIYSETKKPTCTSKGEGEYLSNAFTNPAFKSQKEKVELDMKAHEYGEWEIVQEPTVDKEGIRRRYCECGHYEEEIIDKLDKPVVPDTDDNNQNGNGTDNNKPDNTTPDEPENNEEVDDTIDAIDIIFMVAVPTLLVAYTVILIVYLKHRKNKKKKETNNQK